MTEPLSVGPHADPELVGALEDMFGVLRRHADGTATQDDAAAMAATSTRPLGGGRNNNLFACTIGSETVCVKLHRPTRQRSTREWDALVLLAHRGLPVAPAPICYQPSERRPAMAMSLLPGGALGETRLSPDLVTKLAATNRQLHAVGDGSREAAQLPVRLTDTGMLRKVRRFFNQHADATTPRRKELLAGWSTWSAGPDPAALTEPAAEVLGQGDPNLTNCLWDGEHVRLIDFEYGGWTNRPYELALLIEHVQSRRTPDHLWASLVDQSALSRAELRRVPAARRLVAWFWVMTFWPPSADDDPRFVTQAQRALHLLSERSR